MKRTRTLATFSLTLTASLLAAQVVVSGRVTEAGGGGVAGVNVYCPSTYEGATTDSLGAFAFTATAAFPFAVHTQYVGMRPDSARVVDAAAAKTLTLRLRPTAASLSEVVVTAGAFVASDTRKTAVLSSVDVATTGATADLAEALSTLPGSTPAGESGQLLVRGGTAAETQAYINGLRMPNLYGASVADVPARVRFSPFAFEGITFATGGFSAAYGDALSGALILQTKGRPTEAITSVNAMTLGGSLGHTQPLGDHHALAVDVGGTHLGLYGRLTEETRRTLERAPQGLTANLGYWYEGDDGRNLRVMHQSATQHLSGVNPDEAIFYGVTRRAVDNVNTYTQAMYQQPAGPQGLWTLGAAVATNHDRFEGDDDATELDQLDLQLRVEYADQWADRARWRVGTEGQGRREAVAVNIPEMTTVAEVDRGYAAAFAEADWFLASRWVLRSGLRVDHYDGQATRISPRLQLSYLFSAAHQLALSGGRYVQRQSDRALFGRDAALDPAELGQLGLTYSRTWDGRVLRAEAYAKRYDRLLTTTPGEEAFGLAGDGFAHGLDLFFRDRKTVRNADFWVSYSFTDAERRRGDLAERAPVPFASRHNVAVVAKRYFPGPGLGLSATYRWHAGRPYDDPNRAERFAGVTPDFHDLSLNVSHITQIAGHFTVLFASLTNVTGARQVNQYRFAVAPDVAGDYARLEVDPLFPRFPFVGMFVSIGDRDREGTVDDI